MKTAMKGTDVGNNDPVCYFVIPPMGAVIGVVNRFPRINAVPWRFKDRLSTKHLVMGELYFESIRLT